MGTVFDIQTYAVYDGPGIRTCVFFKGCPLSCAWCHNPESQGLKPEMGYLASLCRHCGACVKKCPNGALAAVNNVIKRDRRRCVACGLCRDACPNGAHEVIGYETSAEAVVREVALDKPFFAGSSGGVTLTGGEPTMQREFFLETARLLKKNGIHTALETCGLFGKELAPVLIDSIDLFLYDIKHVQDNKHKRFTGAGTGVIHANFSAIVRQAGSSRIIPRVPLIPGFNADRASMEAICLFLKDARYRGPVHLMPYNRLAKSKYEKLGRERDYHDMGQLTEDIIDDCVARLRDHGFEAVMNH